MTISIFVSKKYVMLWILRNNNVLEPFIAPYLINIQFLLHRKANVPLHSYLVKHNFLKQRGLPKSTVDLGSPYFMSIFAISLPERGFAFCNYMVGILILLVHKIPFIL